MSDDTGKISDGYHTFDELYEHRVTLFACLANRNKKNAWKSYFHSDGTSYEGWFIAGMTLPTGQITYHIPLRDWDRFQVKEFDRALAWDGHTPNDVLERLRKWEKA